MLFILCLHHTGRLQILKFNLILCSLESLFGFMGLKIGTEFISTLTLPSYYGADQSTKQKDFGIVYMRATLTVRLVHRFRICKHLFLHPTFKVSCAVLACQVSFRMSLRSKRQILRKIPHQMVCRFGDSICSFFLFFFNINSYPPSKKSCKGISLNFQNGYLIDLVSGIYLCWFMLNSVCLVHSNLYLHTHEAYYFIGQVIFFGQMKGFCK